MILLIIKKKPFRLVNLICLVEKYCCCFQSQDESAKSDGRCK